MDMENTPSNCQSKGRSGNAAGAGASGGLYGLGFIGALVYYIVHATSFLAGCLGVLKALVWPAFVVYELMAFLKM